MASRADTQTTEATEDPSLIPRLERVQKFYEEYNRITHNVLGAASKEESEGLMQWVNSGSLLVMKLSFSLYNAFRKRASQSLYDSFESRGMGLDRAASSFAMKSVFSFSAERNIAWYVLW